MLIDSKYFSPQRYAAYFRKRAAAWEAQPCRYSARLQSWLHRNKGHHQYTLIAACFNVENHISAFIDSLLAQRLDFRNNIRLICVDDGSTDSTADIIKRYAAQYPENITLLAKEHGGRNSARMAGLSLARTEWVAFPDPHDTFDFNALHLADRAIAAHVNAALVSLNAVEHHESTGAYRLPTTPLFKNGRRCSRAGELGNALRLHVASGLFRKSIIEKHGLRFSEACAPFFDDAHFTALYLAHVQGKEVLYLRRAKYYRSISADAGTADRNMADKRIFREVILYGHLDMLQRYASMGIAPDYAARVFFHETIERLRRLVNHPQRWVTLSAEERSGYIAAVRRCFAYITPAQIDAIDTNGNNWYWRLGMLFCFKQIQPTYYTAIVERYTQQEREITLRLFCPPNADIRLYDGDASLEPVSSKGVRYQVADETFLHETVLIIPPLAKGHRLRMTCNGRPVCFAYRQDAKGIPALRTLQLWLPVKEHETLRGWNSHQTLSLATGAPNAADLSLTTDSVRRAFACPPPCTDAAYNHAWVFMDRLHLADDNAEHLYRYTAAQQPEFPIFYVLHRDSADWARLAAEGFRLLSFGSKQHKAALHGCDVIISSHVNEEQLDPFRDDCLVTKKYAFLQHGVTHDNCSSWLNGPKIDLFVTTTPPEWKDVQNETYKYTAREAQFVGFPRYDRLLSLADAKKNNILILPTWRSYLMWSDMSAAEFSQTPYFRHWNDFLNSDILRCAHEEYGYTISFFAHPGLRERTPWLEAFRLPAYVTLPPAGTGYQQLFSESAICITDYSSAIFDAAVLQRAILYYQFDRDEFWGNHLRDPGYFSFDNDGFGPVAQSPAALQKELSRILANGGEATDLYRRRMENTFTLRDGRNCERCYHAIRKMLHLPTENAVSRHE